VPAGWTEVCRDEFTGGLANWSIYDFPSIPVDAAAGHWLTSQVSIVTVSGTPELQLRGGKDGSGHPIGGACFWKGPTNQAIALGGRWEFRIRYDASTAFAGVAQLWSDTDPWPTHGEFDITEWGGGSRTNTETNIHYSPTADDPAHDTYSMPLVDFSQFHDVAFEWQQGSYCATYVDDVKVADTRDGTGLTYQWSASRIVVPSIASTVMRLTFQADFLDPNLSHYENSGVAIHVARVRYLVPS
jgi:hypothetical protein